MYRIRRRFFARRWWPVAAVVAAAAALAVAPRDNPLTAADDPPAQLPPELQRIPTDSAIFAHLKVAELWNGPVGQDARKTLGKDAPKVLKQIKDFVGVGLDEVESASLYVPKFKQPSDPEVLGFVITTVKPYDREAIIKRAPKGLDKPKNPELHPFSRAMVVHFTSDRTFAIVERTIAEDYLKGMPKKDGVLAEAVRLAAGKHAFVGAISPINLPDEARRDDNPELAPFIPLFSARSAILVGDAGKDTRLDLRIRCEDAGSAGDAEKSLKLLLQLARGGLDFGLAQVDKDKEMAPFLPFLKALAAGLKEAKVRRDGDSLFGALTVKGEVPAGPWAKYVFLKSVAGSDRARDSNNLKQIAIAMHNYHSVYNVLPAAAICDKRGKPLLSWRVSILPYVEQDALYKEFKLDEPWDSPHNKKLLAKMPKVYALPGVSKDGDTTTYYRVFVGNGAAFDYIQGARFQDIPDGTSNTLLVATAAEAVPWTKPDELEFDPKKPASKQLGYFHDGFCNIAMCDGSVRAITKKVSDKMLSFVIQRNDGNPIPSDF